MRIRLVLALLGVVAASALFALVGASGAQAAVIGCGDGPCVGGLSGLASDIGINVPPAYQQPFLLAVGLAGDLLHPPVPIHPPSPCLAAFVLDGIGYGAQLLFHRGVIGSAQAAVLVGDVTVLNNGIIATHPPDPCFSAIHFRSAVAST